MVHDNTDVEHQEAHSDDPQPRDVQPGCIALPAETIHHIFRFLSPCDLIRIQLVSKRFRAIVSDPPVWRTARTIACFPLPPGPFTWQSVRFLQRALISSARLASTWIAQPPIELKTTTYVGPRTISLDRNRWVRGRWLVKSAGMRVLRAQDIEMDVESLLWDHESYSNWAATTVMNELGHFFYLAVHLGDGTIHDPVKLLEFIVNDDSGHLSFTEMMDVPTWCLVEEAYAPSIRADGGNAPYAYISLCAAKNPRHSLMFDPRSREFYKFPRFQTQLDILLHYRGKWLPRLVGVHFTRTHLFVFSRCYLIHDNLGDIELIQTFAIPEVNSDPNGSTHKSDSIPAGQSGASDHVCDNGGAARPPVVRELRLTHEMFTYLNGYTWETSEPLRDGTVDPVSGAITLRFMHTYSPFHPLEKCTRLVCADYILPANPGSTCPTPALTLPNTNTDGPIITTTTRNLDDFINIVRSTDTVLPIILLSHKIVSIPGLWRSSLIHISTSGYLRGLCQLGGLHTQSRTIPRDVIRKFTVDATGDQCVAVVGDPCPSPPWPGFNLSGYYDYSMDAMRGKIWYIKGKVPDRDLEGRIIDEDTLAIVIDFK